MTVTLDIDAETPKMELGFGEADPTAEDERQLDQHMAAIGESKLEGVELAINLKKAPVMKFLPYMPQVIKGVTATRGDHLRRITIILPMRLVALKPIIQTMFAAIDNGTMRFKFR